MLVPTDDVDEEPMPPRKKAATGPTWESAGVVADERGAPARLCSVRAHPPFRGSHAKPLL